MKRKFCPEKIDEAIKLAGLTRADVVRCFISDHGCKTSRQSLDQWASGERKLNVDKIGHLADITGVSTEFFYEFFIPNGLTKK